MKKFKTKTYDYKSGSDHVKLLFQWHRKGDVEVTLIVIKGKHRNLSGFFAIAPTKKEAVEKLYYFCAQAFRGSGSELIRFLPLSTIANQVK